MSIKFKSLTSREQRLLALTLTLLIVIVVGVAGYKGYDHLRIMDRRISSIEQELLNLNEQILQQDTVEAAYSQVVSEHSTVLTKEEIHDSLRREILRLRLSNPDIPESEQKGSEEEKYIVQIPVLREGLLSEEGEGYREYQIRFRVPSCTIKNALEFLKRLEESDLLLRIDSYEMTRPHTSTRISLMIEVTRTVLSEIEIKSPDKYSSDWDSALVIDHQSGSGRAIL